MTYLYFALLLLLGGVHSQNSTLPDSEDTCGALVLGPWSTALEDWATALTPSDRHGRVMVLAPSKGYYVTDRVDPPFLSPPPPPPPPHHPPPPHMPPSSLKQHIPLSYNEWDTPTPGSKIVNRPSSPYKDKFKPSYPPPTPGPNYQNSIDRVDDPPKKQVSETDLYLLSAMEKLVYRADLMEKRLRRVEESLHLLVAGTENKREPCASDFSRVGDSCYWWSRDAADWKDASRACRRRSAALLELPTRDHTRHLLAKLLADNSLKGADFWTGGLNPGLLWIWSHSARPVQANDTTNATTATATVTIVGDGRCLALAYEPAMRTYVFRGQDCALKHRYICQLEEDTAKLSNEIHKTARMLRLGGAYPTLQPKTENAHAP